MICSHLSSCLFPNLFCQHSFDSLFLVFADTTERLWLPLGSICPSIAHFYLFNIWSPVVRSRHGLGYDSCQFVANGVRDSSARRKATVSGSPRTTSYSYLHIYPSWIVYILYACIETNSDGCSFRGLFIHGGIKFERIASKYLTNLDSAIFVMELLLKLDMLVIT